MLYRARGVLRPRLAERDVVADGDLETRHERDGDRCRPTVGSMSVEYPVPETVVDPAEDPTPFVAAEHFDLGLFVVNVLGDPARREIVYRR
ncbi:hypothetical protein [Streptomyces sp. NPDC002889]|uniref:hypothetical protein n=1 Tax=Streptomyces sp. NPDC002889 TaxID=3364669 RepID=UPI0036A4A8D2